MYFVLQTNTGFILFIKLNSLIIILITVILLSIIIKAGARTHVTKNCYYLQTETCVNDLVFIKLLKCNYIAIIIIFH